MTWGAVFQQTDVEEDNGASQTLRMFGVTDVCQHDSFSTSRAIDFMNFVGGPQRFGSHYALPSILLRIRSPRVRC
jgi:hypothetical protein